MSPQEEVATSSDTSGLIDHHPPTDHKAHVLVCLEGRRTAHSSIPLLSSEYLATSHVRSSSGSYMNIFPPPSGLMSPLLRPGIATQPQNAHLQTTIPQSTHQISLSSIFHGTNSMQQQLQWSPFRSSLPITTANLGQAYQHAHSSLDPDSQGSILESGLNLSSPHRNASSS